MRLAIFAVVGILPLASLFTPARLDAARAFREGSWLYTRQQFAEAIPWFERSVGLDPTRGEAWFFLANAYQASMPFALVRKPPDDEKLARARQAYARALGAGLGGSESTKPLQAEALAALAGLHAGTQNPDEVAALAHASKLARDFPADPRAQYILARTYEDLGRHPEAAVAYKKLAEAYPKDSDACYAAAEYRRRSALLDQQAERLVALEQCAAIVPNDPSGYYRVAVAHFEVMRFSLRIDDAQRLALADKGLAFVDRALAIRPDYPEAVTYKIVLLRQKALASGDGDARRRYYDEADTLARMLREREARVPR
jgi:tetratricopeptide (TPR) repeat protein